MIEQLEKLVEALREELQQYGEMLARLDFHQDLVMRRETQNLLQSVAEIQAQAEVIQAARRRRESAQQQLARALGLAEQSILADFAPLLPGEYRPLVKALVDENNELLVRVRQRSRQNHLLLARTVEMMHRFMDTLFPEESKPVYSPRGALFERPAPAPSIYEAVG